MPPGATNTEAANAEDMSDKEIITVFEIKYNTEFHRWEVYRAGRNVIRGGEVQPVFVGTETACELYARRCERGNK